MQKSLILILLLLVLSAVGICYAHSSVNSAKDAVELTETTLIGDVSAAKGLSVNLRSHYQNHLFWDTTLLPGQLPTTEFLFSQSEIKEKMKRDYRGVQIYLSTNMGASSNGNIELFDANTGGMAAIFKDVASRTENGTTNREIVFIKDYYDFYPMGIEFDLPGNYHTWMDSSLEQEINSDNATTAKRDISILEEMENYFRFPVLEEHQLEITITKDDDGNVVELNSSTVDGSNVWFDVINANINDSYYFAISAKTQENLLLDYSYVPGGYGIYRLPVATIEEPIEVTIDDMDMVYPLASTEQILVFKPNADKTKLLLVVQEKNSYILKILDGKTAQELQRIPLMDAHEEYWVTHLHVGEDFLVTLFNERDFLVLQETDRGSYEVQYSGVLPEDKLFSFNYNNNPSMAFDGERLAIAAVNDLYSHDTLCGFSIVVYDETGILYAGRYDSSLDKGQPENYSERCKSMDYDPLSIRWE
jgi:hypothetical protein